MFDSCAIWRFIIVRRFPLVRVVLMLILVLNGVPSRAAVQGRPRRVLILYSFDRDEAVFASFDREMRSELEARLHERVEFYTEDLDTVRFNSPQYARDFAKLLQSKYSSLKPDLVIPISYAALRFALGEGKGPFSGVPVVALFNASDMDAVKAATTNPSGLGGITGVATAEEPARTLELALKLQPDAKRVAVVIGSSDREQAELQELQHDFSPYEHQVAFSYLTGLTMEGLLQEIRKLPSHAVVLNTFFFEDANGQFFLPEEALDLISHASPVPVYGIDSTDIDHGVVGGHMTDPARLGLMVATLGARVMKGENPSNIPIVTDNSARDTVDWRELQRWNISEKRLPAGAVELFREPTPWERYRIVILAAVSFAIAETLLVLALIFNLNRLKRTERALLREKTLAEAVIENLPGIFILQDETGKNIRWNRNAQQLRYPLGEVPRLGNVAEYDREAAERARREVFADGHGELEVDILTADDGTAPYYVSGVRVELEGKPCMTVIGTDLSARKYAESALRRSEAQLRSFVANAPYGIARASVSDDKFLSANPALAKMLGYQSEEEVLALKLSRDLYVGGDSNGFRAQPTRADFFHGVEFTWKRRDGKPITVQASGRRISAKELGDVLEVIVEDVSARRVLEDQLRQAQKMEALGQLAGSTAHDFNNLLAVIIGHCELLAATLSDEDPAKSRVEIIKKAGERAVSLTAQLLAFSRRQVMQLKTVNLNSLVRETNKMLEHLMGEDIEYRLELDPNLGMTRADPGQMVQVIMNLAVNARDAMPHGGILAITTTPVAFQGESFVRGVVIPAGSYVMLSVSDTGTGMDADTRAHLFEPFFTTKPVGKGTGLGLATVFGIVKQSGGFIFADSEPGKGTIFKVYLPQVEAVAESTAAEVSAAPPRIPRTVLIVEDEPAFRDLLVEGLQTAGYRVLVGENGVDALRAAEQYSERIDLLLTDVIMPQMSGPDLARCLKGVRPEVRVLYMSGYTDDKLQAISSDEEVALLQKPFHMQNLLRKIEELLDHNDDHNDDPGTRHKKRATGQT